MASERLMRRDPLAHPERLIRAVYAYVAYRVGPGMDAEDITSEVFERALRYRESYDPKRGEPMAWLIGIARRCVNGALEDPQRTRGSVEDRAAPGDLAEDAVRRLSLLDAVSQLGERERELIALRYGADLTGRQIGAILDMSANAVDVAMHRAVERLRQALDGSDESETF
jgi:RNA polymerase sigma-70 factor, ECF subfamily